MIPKPPRPVLNRAHPLARGLRHAMAMQDSNALGALPFVLIDSIAPGRTGWNCRGGGSARTIGSLGWAWNCDDAAGIANQGVDTGDFMPMGNDAPWALAFWCRPTGASFQCLVSRWKSGVGNYSSIIFFANNPSPGLARFGWERQHNDGVNYDVAYGAGESGLIGTTHHVVATSTVGGGCRLYMDGRLIAEQASTGDTTPSPVLNNASLGVFRQNATYSFPWDGDVYDVRYWSRGLTDADVRSLYSDPWALYRAPRRTLRGSVGVASHAYYYRNFVASRAHQ